MANPEATKFDFGLVSQDRYSTYHYKQFCGTELPVPNQDYAHFMPGVGAFVADGVGSKAGGADISKLAVIALEGRADRLGIRYMGADEAVEATHEVLHHTDEFIGNYKADRPEIEAAATTLGGILIARRHVIAVGIGDTPVFRYGAVQQNGLRITTLTQLTDEQGEAHKIFNSINGQGRPPAPWSRPGIVDIVRAIPVEPGDRYAILSDGILGDKPEQRLPAERITKSLLGSSLAQGAAEVLAFLPTRLILEEEKVNVNGELVPYQAKLDDASVVTVFVRSPENS